MTASQPASGIVTPEAVVLEFETAGVGSRLVAGFIDVAVQGALLVTVLFATAAVVSSGLDLGGLGIAMLYVLVFLVTFGYPVLLETMWHGRTLGKAALGLRVVTVEGAPVRFRHAAIRSILALVDWFITQGIVGIVALLLTKRNQRLGDLVAGTIVLRERTAARAAAPVAFVAPPGLEAYTERLATATIGHDTYGSIRSFLLRAPTLPPHVRHDLASQLAHPLLERLRTQPPPGASAEAFLVCVAAAYQRRMAASAGTSSSRGFDSVWSGLANTRDAADAAGAVRTPALDAPPAATGFVPPA